MKGVLNRIRETWPDLQAALIQLVGRFPWMLLCAVTGTAAAMDLVERKTGTGWYAYSSRIFMTAALGLPLFFALRIWQETKEKRQPKLSVEWVGFLLLAGYFFWQSAELGSEPQIISIRWALLMVGLHGCVAISGFMSGAEGVGFWQFNRRIFTRFCLTSLYTGVLTLGLELALLSAEKLFELNIRFGYMRLFLVMIGIFHPLFFLAGVPRDFDALEIDEPYPKPLKAFTQIALAPLVAIFTGILYVYTFKIIGLHSWPRGWVALPVLLLSGVGILAVLLLHPLRNQPEQRWARWFMHYFPRALAPLSILLLLSLRERITAYGVTESRYLGMLVGGWLLAWSFVSVIWQNVGIRWVPVSLALACFMTSAGPWSAGSISRQSQLRQLVGLLERGGLMVDGKIRPPEKETLLPGKDYERLESTLKYLVATHGRGVVREIFDDLLLDTSKVEGRRPSWGYTAQVMGKLRLRKMEDKNGRYIPEYKLIGGNAFPLDGFRRARFFNSSLASKEALVGDLWMKVEEGALKARFKKEDPWENVPMDTLFASLTKQNESEIPLEKMSADWEIGGRSFHVIFTDIFLQHGTADGALNLRRCSLLLLER